MKKFFIILVLLLYAGSLFPCDFFTRGKAINVPSFVPNDTSQPLSNHEPPKTYLTFPLDMSPNIVGATLAVARKGEATKNISNNITIFMLWRQHPF